ncbi:MAG: fused MFS/spermidine synthase [Acidobacteriota bacterium]
MSRGLFFLIFGASGGAALVYEVTWTRLLTQTMGHGVAAVSTVLAAFMGGLAVGSALGGRVAARLPRERALTAYAQLELAIAGLALLLPVALSMLAPLLAAVYGTGGGPAFGALRLGASLALLAVPAAAMGATFPIAARWMVPFASRAASDAGRLYAANTVGAALGAIGAGFVLLPALGLRGTTWIGVLLNVTAAVGAFWIARRAAAMPSPAAGRGSRPSATVRAATGSLWRAAAALGLSGFASLTLQVAWTRLLALVLGPTTYAFSAVVAMFIAGLAAGAALGARLASRASTPVAGLASCLAVSAALALGATAFVDESLLAMAGIVASPGATFSGVLVRQVGLVAAMLVPLTVAFGAAFPFAVAVATRSDESIAGDLGIIYAVNTAGAIAGALAAGFVLLPALGLQDTIRVVTGLTALGAAALVATASRATTARLAVAASASLILVAAAVLPPWNRLLLSSGAYKYAATLTGPDLETALTAGELLYYREGATATVAVRELTGTRSLAIDGKVDASNAGDMLTQRLLAHLPLLLHPSPSRVAILGLGSGVTLGSALTHPIDEAVVLEISPEVVEGSAYFEAENHRALADPRTRLIVGDGRTHLMLTDDRYDVIVSEPSNPWMAGIASLFTREFFEAARGRLTADGVLCQWAHTYDISEADLQSILATFLQVFPHGTVWLVGEGDVLMLGSPAPLVPRLEALAGAWSRPGVAADLATVGVAEPFHLLSMFVGNGDAVGPWVAGAVIQRDDHARLEFTGPRSLYGISQSDNAATLRALAERGRPDVVRQAIAGATADQWRSRGRMLLRADAFRTAYDDFVRALALDPANRDALAGLLDANAVAGRTADVEARLTALAAAPDNLPARLALSRLRASQGAFDEAARIALAAIQAAPGNVDAVEQLASILADVGDLERLRPVVARLRADAPDSDAARYYAAALLFAEGRPELAAGEVRALVARNPTHAKGQNLLGAVLASLGRRDEARQAFHASLAAAPREPTTYANLGSLELQAGNLQTARRYFAEALTIEPTNRAALEGLAEVSNRLNR